MKTAKRIAVSALLVVMVLFISFGYASLTDMLAISGNVELTQPYHNVYITNVAPSTSAGVTVYNTNGTVFFANVSASGTATFRIDFINVSSKVYVYERVIDGAEVGLDGIYTGDDIKYEVSGVKTLDEIAPSGGTLSLNITITVPRNVTAENYVLKFNFIEKTGTEILPGDDEFDITFQYNNGQPSKTISLHENEFVPRPETPEREGYIFRGWYTDAACTSAWNFEIDRVSADMTLYAGWERETVVQYNVIFMPNNGDVNYVVTVTANSLVPPQDVPVRDGYTFIGWYKDSACTSPWNLDTDRVNANTVLYGGWEVYVPPVPPDCNITFKPNNGEPDTTITVLTGEFIPRPTTPIRAGYTFTGWYVDEDCTEAWNFEANKVEWHTVLYGGWDKEYVVEQVEYTVTFKPNNGTADSAIKVVEGSLIPIPATPAKDGYIFIGWYTDSNCTQGWNFDTDTVISNMTLYAGWEKYQAPSQGEYHKDFMGLVEALLSKNSNCLNNNNLIFDAVMESLTSKKRPKEDAPILHCSVNSVSGGTMSSIAQFANSNLTQNLHFIFEVDPDPAYQNSRMRLYMYYAEDCNNAKLGDEITVYQQIVTRGSDGVWYADGTYIGSATVGEYFGGGNAGKDVKTISPYTWKSTAAYTEE